MQGNNINLEILENPLAILESVDIFNALKEHWINNHQKLTEPKKFVGEFFELLKTSDAIWTPSVQEGHWVSADEIKKCYEKKLKEYKLAVLPKAENGDMFYEIIKPELAGVETILDFGCGKLIFLKNIADQDKNVKNFIGVDPKSNPVLDDLDERIQFERSLENIPEFSVDLAVIKLVLHHLEEQEILEIFKKIKQILKPEGKLIVFEESFPEIPARHRMSLDQNDHKTSDVYLEAKNYLAKFNLEMSEATESFLRLSKEDKIKFLFMNDWLMNLQNDYMPWTLQYKSMEEWIDLIESVGFKQKEAHFLGAVKNRKRKQGMTAMMIFGNKKALPKEGLVE